MIKRILNFILQMLKKESINKSPIIKEEIEKGEAMPLFNFVYGKDSLKEYYTLHPYLQLILIKLLKKHDHSIVQGGRTPEEQQKMFDTKASTLAPPNGKHLLRKDNLRPNDKNEYSFAADICPFINNNKLATTKEAFGKNQMAQFTYFLGILKEIADNVLEETEYTIRLGINWDQDEEILTDQNFDDYFHIELVLKRS